MEEIDLKRELTLLLEKEVGFTGKFILEKQCRNLEIDPDCIKPSDLEDLAAKVTWAIKGYTGEKRADEIRRSIMEYRTALGVVEHSLDKEDSPEDIIEAQMTIAAKKLAVGMNDKAIEPLEKARAVSKDLDKKAAKAADSRISRMMGRVLSGSSATLEEAMTEFQRAIISGEESNQPYEVSLSWNGLGSINWRLGQHQNALDCYLKALTTLEPFKTQSRNDKIKKQGAEAVIKSGLGNVYLDLLDYDSAVKYNEEAIEVFKAMGNEAEVGRVYNNLARVFEEMGNYPRAIDRYERAIKYCEGSGSNRMHGWALTNLASALVENGRTDDAKSYLNKAEKILGNFTDPIAISKLNCMWGKYYREKADWQNAAQRFEKSIEAITDNKSPDYLAIAQEEFGIMYLKKGDKAKAKDLLINALEWYKEKKDTVRMEKLTKMLADIKT